MIRTILLLLLNFIVLLTIGQQREDYIQDSLATSGLINEAMANLRKGNGKEGLAIAKLAAVEAKKINHEALIMESIFYTAASLNQLKEIDSSIYYYEKLLAKIKGSTVSRTLNEKWIRKWFFWTTNNLHLTYSYRGEYEKALDKCLEAVELYESKGDTLFLAKMYSLTGGVYDRIGEYRKSIFWNRKAKSLSITRNDLSSVRVANTGIGIAYDELGEYDSAHFYNQLALEHAFSIEDTSSIITISSNIGNTYTKEYNWEEAKKYLEYATQLNVQYIEKKTLAVAHINLGNVYINLGEYERAKKVLRIALAYAREDEHLQYESEGYLRLYELYQKVGRFDSSLFYFKKYEAIEDSLYNLEKTKEVLALSTRYETEKKEQQILLQEATLQEKERELRVKQQTILLLVALTLLVIVIAFGFYKHYQARKEAELQSRIIAEQEKGIQAVFQAQEEERKRISKDLHDGVGQQLSGIKMAFHRIAKTLQEKDPEQKEAMDKLGQVITESADEVRSISHQMMPRVLTEVGLIEAIQGMLEKSLKLSGIEYEFEHFGIERRLPEKVEIGLYRVCQELINNIIKHSGAKQVNVQLMKNKKNIVLLVEDDGLGISPSKSEGHGLLNMKSRINTLNGELNLEPSPTSGTLATIRVPL